MIIPFNQSGSMQAPQQQAQPTEAHLLMALATMHQQGAFPQAQQGERLLYPLKGRVDADPSTLPEGPLNISPTPLSDPKAIGVRTKTVQ